MAQRRVVVLVDDVDGSEADETVEFALDGKGYEIDLTAERAQELRGVLAPYAGFARVSGGRRRRRSPK